MRHIKDMNTAVFYSFYQIVNQLITRHGADILDVPQFKVLLGDYSQNSFPDESRLLLLAQKAGIHKKIALAPAEDVCGEITTVFSEEYFLEPETAECMVRLLWSVIHKTAFSVPVRSLAVHNAGIYTRWRKQRPPVAAKTAPRKNGPDFIHIDGVIFTAGRMEPYVNRNIRKITLQPFSIMSHPVTQLEYWELTGDSPAWEQGDRLAAEGVNWYQAIEFCNLKNKKEGLGEIYIVDKNTPDPNNTYPSDPFRWTVRWDKSRYGFRLPTAAEWEYASRFFEIEKNLLEWCWDKLEDDTPCHLCGGYIERENKKHGITLPDLDSPKIGLMEMDTYGDGVCLNVNKNKSNLGKPCYSWAGPTGIRLVLEDR
jgi:formylglycine-generating enzyme required for sulfatase activity